MGTYVVGDIHGYYEEWLALKDKIEKLDPSAIFILVGDILDRGPKSWGMVQWAMEHVIPDGKYRMVLGNHEDLKIEWWKKYRINKFENELYDFDKLLIKQKVTEEDVEKMIAFFETLPVVIELDIQMKARVQHYIISHAAMSPDFLTEDGYFDYEMLERDSWIKYGIEETLQSPRNHILWERNFWGNLWKYDTIFVHGHNPTSMRDLIVRGANAGMIDFKEKDINVDCGNYVIGDHRNLGAICLEDLEEFYLMDMDVSEELQSRGREFYKEKMLKMIGEE